MRIPAVLLSVTLLIGTTEITGAGHAGAQTSTEIEEARRLFHLQRHEEAESLAREILAEARHAHGTDSPEAAAALDLLVEVLISAPDPAPERAEPLAAELVDLNIGLFGEQSPAVVRSLGLLGDARDEIQDREAAAEAFDRALALLDSGVTLSPEQRGRFWFGYGWHLRRGGDLDEAIGRFTTAREAYVEGGLDESPRMVPVLLALGETCWRRGDTDEAETWFESGRQLSIRIFGPNHPRTCTIRTSLAACAYQRGDFDSAGSQQREAIVCLEQTLPPTDGRILHGLQNLAWLRTEMGRYTEADSAYVRLLELRRDAEGPETVSYLELLTGYATHLYYSGATSEALPYAEEAAEGLRKVVGLEAPESITAVATLADIHRALGNFQEARRLYAETVEVLEEDGTRQRALGISYNGMGLVALDLGEPDEAYPWFEKAIAVTAESQGPEHYFVARGYSHLGDARAAMGEMDRALQSYRRAIEIFDTALGPGSVEALENQLRLGRILARHVDRDEGLRTLRAAMQSMTSGADESPAQLGNALHLMAEVYLEQGRATVADSLETRAIEELGKAYGPESLAVAWSLATRAEAKVGRDDDAAFSDAVRAEEIGMRHMVDQLAWLPERTALTWAQRRPQGLPTMWEVARRTKDASQIGAAWERQLSARAQVLDELGRRAQLARALEDPAVFQASSALRRARERLAHLALDPETKSMVLRQASEEKKHAEREFAKVLGARPRTSRPDPVELARAIPPSGALVSYVRTTTEPRHYLALVLRHDDDLPSLLDLGSAKAIDDLVTRWGESIQAGAEAVGALVEPAIETTRDVGDGLRGLVFDPLADRLQGAERVWIVPDGSLHGVSFAALPLENERWLLDEVELVLLSAERDLLAPEPARVGRETLLCVGDPSFESDALGAIASATGFRSQPAVCADFDNLEFTRLPHSLDEVEAVRAHWRPEAVTVLVGDQAREAAVKQAGPAATIIHLATHAFFLGGDCTDGTDPSHDATLSRTVGENPLLLSGLALAGANRRDTTSSDGILTAEEIAALELEATDLVVLSACETGTGLPVAGEGLIGLRRAFRLAGAKVLVASLWPVDDRAASAWMTAFYDALREQERDPAAAAVTASRSIRRSHSVGGAPAHPAHWASFVVSGVLR